MQACLIVVTNCLNCFWLGTLPIKHWKSLSYLGNVMLWQLSSSQSNYSLHCALEHCWSTFMHSAVWVKLFIYRIGMMTIIFQCSPTQSWLYFTAQVIFLSCPSLILMAVQCLVNTSTTRHGAPRAAKQVQLGETTITMATCYIIVGGQSSIALNFIEGCMNVCANANKMDTCRISATWRS